MVSMIWLAMQSAVQFVWLISVVDAIQTNENVEISFITLW